MATAEQFLRSTTVRHQLVEIPYLCTEEYENGPFLSYPEWQNFHRAVRAHHGRAIEASADDIDSFSMFLRNWLCFGLVSAVFGRPVQSEKFTRGTMGHDGQPRRVLDSTGFVGFSTEESAMDLGIQHPFSSHVPQCSQIASSMIPQGARHTSRTQQRQQHAQQIVHGKRDSAVTPDATRPPHPT